jgi:hypothetical protein
MNRKEPPNRFGGPSDFNMVLKGLDPHGSLHHPLKGGEEIKISP